MDNLYVGIDVSKECSSAQGIDEGVNKVFYLTFKMDAEGFPKLLKAIKSNCKDQGSVIIAMESTACYHVNLFCFLTSKGFKVLIINPLLICNFVKLSLRKTKTDKKDAMAIARFLLIHKDSLTQDSVSSDISDLRDLSRQRESLVDQMTAVKNDVTRLLTITFPELQNVAGTFTKSMLRLLCKYPSAQAVRCAKDADIADTIIPGSMGRNNVDTVSSLKQAAESSIGTASFTKEMIIKQKASLLIHLDAQLQEITSVLIEHCQSMMQ